MTKGLCRGTAHHSAKLTDDDVRRMRYAYEGGRDCRRLAREFGITHQAAWAACTRRSWKHVT